MKLLTKEIERQLRRNAANPDGDHRPALKLFNPCGAGTWLFTTLEDDGDTLFGLCDPGFGTPELGYASLAEIASLRLPFGLRIERDLHFTADRTLAEYADEARHTGRIAA